MKSTILNFLRRNKKASKKIELYLISDLEISKNNIRFYIKLDYAYLAAFGTIFTLLRLNREEVFSFLDSLNLVVFVALGLLSYDTVLYGLALLLKTTNDGRKANPINGSILHYLTVLQPLTHLLFIGYAISYTMGYSHAFAENRLSWDNKIAIQRDINLFSEKYHRFPKNINELKADFSDVDGIIRALKPELVRYTATSDTSYVLVFSGSDGVFGTSDDFTVYETTPLDKIRKEIEASEENYW